MLRLFAQHQHRPVESLDGLWDFTLADTGPIRDLDAARNVKPPRRYDRTILTPSAWESIPALANHRGQAWFRRVIRTPAAGVTRLVFGGISHTATVFLDGKPIGQHYDAFTPFEITLPSPGEGEHELAIHVDNSFGDHSALHVENDYYTYGGITRPPELHHPAAVHLRHLAVTPRTARGGTWSLDVAVEVVNCSNDAARRTVTVDLDGVTHELGRISVPAGATRTLRTTLTRLKVTPWAIGKPSLYDLHARLLDGDTVTDDLIDRIGFREVKVQGRKLLLNGKSVRLRGFNRHEDLAPFGCAIPVEAIARDLHLFQDLGANFLRTCHYPNDLRLLDLCDAMGIAVWEESHARQIKFDHPAYKRQVTASTTDMVRWHGNRACIVMWGCLNECESRTAAGAAEHGRVLKLLRKLDPSRPTTYASMFHKLDKAYKHADIVSWNRYIGWYGGGIDAIEDNINDLLKWLHGSAKTGGRNKPVILSEFGGGGIAGYRNINRCKWSEEYQADLLDASLGVYLNHPDIMGTAIWQFCDVRITQGWNWDRRPRTMNNKGVVDEYRRPKLAYEVVKRRHAEAAKRWDR